MGKHLIAKATIKVDAPIAKVWDAVINPKIIKKYMFGTTVSSEWKEGSEIKWKGKYKGKKYEDKGEIIKLEPENFLKYTHYSPFSGQEDVPENYNTVSIKLLEMKSGILVDLSQDNNPTEKARKKSELNWNAMLDKLKELLEK